MCLLRAQLDSHPAHLTGEDGLAAALRALVDDNIRTSERPLKFAADGLMCILYD